MDIQAYIESGVLEEYCLGHLNEEDQAYLIQLTMLYPEVKAELNAVELAFEKLAELTASEPPESIKGNIMAALGFDEFVLDANNLPVLSHSTDPQPWLDTFAHFIPEEPTEDFLMHVIRQDNIVQQMLITGNTDVPEEQHGEFYESLFVLRGRCECTIGNELYKLGPGDFIEIPLHTPHDIKLVTPFVTAVLQYRFV
ncbi:cupin domain-containing protein [Mucilaginibacter sp. BJC16-A38]|uniref:cupin domain-containing protein n=1 Tax=Mucilaginibacter phenanthrenivorans TaxID=1234842 RepID=UPI002157302F|nr:cupin domain-containing protein [Mucilaginibacter phenanthrenivorans]MCR8558632.1 cupin domain-containing protein [Mucilaginibacter phenanthrenivorans]